MLGGRREAGNSGGAIQSAGVKCLEVGGENNPLYAFFFMFLKEGLSIICL